MKDTGILYLEHQLCFPLYVASRLTTQLYGPLLKEIDITYPQYLVLLVLWQKDHQSVSEISTLLYLESNTLTPLLKRLEQKQLIRRKRLDSDERVVEISLTEEGKNLQAKAICIPERIIESFRSSETTVAELTDFKKTLLKMINTLEGKTASGLLES
ncbi:MarR family transcriptional regulator [Larkinella knui]|uniref:HTH-type transcriptional regulator SarZ n=1 Tax=Larkinella knui TaxID=2025310 RepID=A0A3P1CBF4_9BACT|nr:MarR family transcriptional regulator [Larkinella knui]RRB10396.1 MarR family transcriptional regulator [Larkinella knui]